MDIKNTINNELLSNNPQSNVFYAIVKAKDDIKDIIEQSGV